MHMVLTSDVPVDPTKAARPGSILHQQLSTETCMETTRFRLIRSEYQGDDRAGYAVRRLIGPDTWLGRAIVGEPVE
jgi:hypothetical protein